MRVENSFVPVEGVGERTERDLWAAGITDWNAAERGDLRSVTGPTTAERIEEYVAVARDHLRRDRARFFGETFPSAQRWRLYGTFRPEACFFDIETTGLDQDRDRVTTVSFHRAGETTTLVRGRDLTADRVRDVLADAPLLVTYNGKRFDVPFLERSFGIEVDRPHLDLLYPCRRLDLTGGLKTVEGDVGIDRDRPDLSGRDAVRLWHRYEDGDEGALDTLVSYNREDARNLRALADHVAGALHDRACEGLDVSLPRP